MTDAKDYRAYALNDLLANIRTHIPDFNMATEIMSRLTAMEQPQDSVNGEFPDSHFLGSVLMEIASGTIPLDKVREWAWEQHGKVFKHDDAERKGPFDDCLKDVPEAAKALNVFRSVLDSAMEEDESL